MADKLLPGALTVDDYHRLGELGVFHEDDRVELLDGQIIPMSPIGRDHAGCVNYLLNTLVRLLGNAAIVRCQNPVRLDRRSEPQPDLALLKRRDDFYRSRHPGPADTYLVIEVADSSLEYDRDIKLQFYARAAVPEVWIVDLNHAVVEIHRDPAGDDYAFHHVARRGETVSATNVPSASLLVDDIL